MTNDSGEPAPPPPRRQTGKIVGGIVLAAVTAFGVAIATGAGDEVWTGIKHLFGAHTAASDTRSPDPGTSRQVVADRIAACERLHGMSRQSVFTTASNGYVARACAWPPPSYADSDGYTEITVESVPIPEGSEASGSWVDRIVGPCATFRLAYFAQNQGGGQHLPAFTTAPQTIVSVGGGAYVDDPQDFGGATLGMRLGFTPATDEVEVVRPSGGVLESLACAS
jgi:hypothetical protein